MILISSTKLLIYFPHILKEESNWYSIILPETASTNSSAFITTRAEDPGTELFEAVSLYTCISYVGDAAIRDAKKSLA